MRSCVTLSLVPEARGGPFVFWDDLSNAIICSSKMGYDAIEIFPPGPEAIDHNSLASMLDGENMKLAALGTGAGWVKHRLQLADSDPGQRARAIAFVRSIIDIAGEFGAPAIIGSMQGRHGDGVSQESALGHLRDALAELSAHAHQYGCPLLYEPLNRYETNQANRVSQAVQLVESVGATANVKLLCDLFHMNIEENDIASALMSVGSHVGHIHFVDSNRRAVGMGHLDFRPIVSALRQIGYEGYLSAEAFPLPNPEAAAEQTMLAFRYWLGSSRQ